MTRIPDISIWEALYANHPDIVQVIDEAYNLVYTNREKNNSQPNTLTLKCYQSFGHNSTCQFCPVEKMKNTGEPKKLACFDERFGQDVSITWVPLSKEQFGRQLIVEYIEKKSIVNKSVESPDKSFHNFPKEDNFLALLFDNIPYPVFYKDCRGKYRMINKAFADFNGASKEYFIGKTVHQVIEDKKLAETYHKADLDLIAKREKQTYQSQVKSKDGTIHDVIFNKSAFINSKGDVEGLIGFIVDITEQKRIENELRMSEERYRNLIELSPESIIMLDLQGYVLTCNKNFCQVSGMTEQEISGKHFSELIFFSKEDLPQFHAIFSSFINQDKISPIEYNWQNTHGEQKTSRAHVGKIFSGNTVIGFQVIVIDITAQKKTMDELIRAKEKAEESDRLKSAFLANISHEIRTPMNGILGFTQLLDSDELTPAVKKRYIDSIHRSGEYLLHIINDIIDISKIEANQIKIVEQAFNLNKLIEELFLFYETNKVPNTEGNITLKISAGLTNQSSVIVTDRNRLRQILSNLLDNAFKYTLKGTITFGYTLQTIKETEYLQFFVRDTGIGIEDSVQDTIFDRFMQSTSAEKMKRGGTGLGLAITRGLVKLLGGRVEFESTPGKGSVFYFTIPYKNATMENNSNQSQRTRKEFNWEGKTILIVEDDEINLEYLEAIFRSTMVNLLISNSGEEAIEMIKESNHISLILMDVRLPGINGLETTKEIKQINPELPIIAQTAYAMVEDKEKSLKAGCDDYISKPINRKELMEKIDGFLGE